MAEENFTNKEMLGMALKDIREVRDLVVTQTEHSKNVDKHLETLNSKVATNVNEINNLKTFKTKVVTYASIGATVVSLFVNKYIGL